MKKFAALALVFGAFVVVGQAAAANYKVAVGEQGRPPAGTTPGATLNAFYPGKLTIHVGDTVTFSNYGFHTVSYVKGAAPPLFAPGDSAYSGISDSAGAAFAFNGLTKLIYNVGAFAPTGGNVVDGSQSVSTGVLQGPKPGQPGVARLSFPKAGVYKLICLVHGPMMKVTVIVKPKAAKVDSPAKVSKSARQQIAGAWAKITAQAKAAKPPVNTVYAGLGDSATAMAFYPQKLTVKAGTTVTWVNQTNMEIHNVVFGPPAYIDGFQKQFDLFPTGPGTPNQVSPALVYGTDPGQAAVYDGTNHGNGFFSTPLFGSVPGLARSTQITFPKAGTYHYFCLLHGEEMAGDIVVTP